MSPAFPVRRSELTSATPPRKYWSSTTDVYTQPVADIGRSIAARLTGLPEGPVGDYVARAARKRVAYIVEPERFITWEHSKLL